MDVYECQRDVWPRSTGWVYLCFDYRVWYSECFVGCHWACADFLRRLDVLRWVVHFLKSKSIHNGISGLLFFFVVGLVAPVLHWIAHQKWPSCWTRYIKWAAIVLLQVLNLLICLCSLAFPWFSWELVCFHLQLQSITSHGPSSVSYSNMLFADATFLGGQNIIMFCRRVVSVAFI